MVNVILYTVLIADERVTVTIKRDGWPLSSCLVSSFGQLDYINQRCKKLFKFEILYILDYFYTIVCVRFHFVIQRQQHSRISCNSQFRGYVLLIQLLISWICSTKKEFRSIWLCSKNKEDIELRWWTVYRITPIFELKHCKSDKIDVYLKF